MIRFNRPYITGKELGYIAKAIEAGHLSGDGEYTKLVQSFFRDRYHFDHNYLTTSGTDALEMAAILAGIGPGDEVIMPSFTFVSTANAFLLRGAKIVFVDSLSDHPNMDHRQLGPLITDRTKMIVAMHYGGVACDMDAIMSIAEKHGLLVVEDAAHSIDSFFRGKPLGGIGHMGCFSFHETKNIISGEGGLINVRNDIHAKRAEIIREKGTDRSAFFRGEVDKYGWVDIGSSFLASELTAAFLYAQVQSIDDIQSRRRAIWETYSRELSHLAKWGYQLPSIPEGCTNNAHLFHLICPSLEERTALIAHLNNFGIKAVFHYQPLHSSTFHMHLNPHQEDLPNASRYGNQLIRLPLFAGLTGTELEFIVDKVRSFVETNNSPGRG